MNCPHCKEKLEPTNSSGIETATCFYCNGTWINHNELKALVDNEKISFGVKEINSESSNNTCPNCDNTKLHQSSIQNIEVESCPLCKGIFVEEGKIEKIFPTTYKSRIDNINDNAKPLSKYLIIGLSGLIVAFLGDFLNKHNIIGGALLTYIGVLVGIVSIFIYHIKLLSIFFGKKE